MDENTTYEMAKEWADIVLERWIRNIVALDVVDTGELLRSLKAQVEQDSGGNPTKIVFSFLYYGLFADMGVGRGVKLPDAGNGNRKKKPWYSKQLWKEVHILSRLMAEKYGQQATEAIALFSGN
jgi:hypothetical protein